MIPSSVRRVVSAAPHSPILASAASSATRAAGAHISSYRPSCHQRRCSSSKPSSPDNGAKGLTAGQSVPTSTQGKSAGEKRRRKAKDSSAANNKNLPSVPSTQHLSQDALALSSFFSLHRPISVTHTFPKAVTEDAFAAIFAPSTNSQRAADVISTLSKTVDDLEGPMAQLAIGAEQQGGAGEGGPLANGATIELKYPDGTDANISVQLNAMSGHFLPFRPPPIPQPQAPGQTAGNVVGAEGAAAEMMEQEPHHRVYKAIFTIEESADHEGEIKITAHSPQLIDEKSLPRTFLERMALRQLRYEDARRTPESMQAISVRRQKKLKMKKKKYKKLMRRTRNLRRKLDRT